MTGRVYFTHPGEDTAALSAAHMVETCAQTPGLLLSDITVWVPSPRVGATLKEALIRVQGGSTLLPRIRPLSYDEDDEEMLRFSDEEVSDKTPLSSTGRTLLLAHWVSEIYPSYTYSQCFDSALMLGRLFDRFFAYDITLDALEKAVPEHVATHWQKNLAFLKVVFEHYPNWLAEEGREDSAMRTRRYLTARANAYQQNGLPGPVYVVGVVDTVPAGVDVMKAVLSDAQGVVVVPGVDLPALSQQEEIPVFHAQYAVSRLLARSGVDVKDIHPLGVHTPSKPSALWAEALRPMPTNTTPETNVEALNGLTYIQAQSEEEEALCIALAMREALEDEGKTCALITPERALAARVKAHMRTWGVQVDDSAGQPLSQSVLGGYFLAVLQVWESNFASLDLIHMLTHPLTQKQDRRAWTKAVRRLETVLLRGPRPSQRGMAGLKARLATWEETHGEDAPMRHVLDVVETAYAPWQSTQQKDIRTWGQTHMDVVLALAGEAQDIHTREEAGDITALFEGWLAEDEHETRHDLRRYSDQLKALMRAQTVRPRHSLHPRVFIWGPLEARLNKVDRVILAPLNEGAWPNTPSPNPWLSPALAQAIGLPPLEMNIGLNAHDFLSLVGGDDVFLVRRRQDGGASTVESRFLSRLHAVATADAWASVCARGRLWQERAAFLRRQGQAEPLAPISANPPQAARPHVWSASTVEGLMRCPYKIYVAKVLALYPLDEFDMMPSARERGNVIHACLEAFYSGETAYKGPLEEEAMCEHLLAIGREVFTEISEEAVRAIWWERFEKTARSFAKVAVDLAHEGRRVAAVEVEARAPLGHGVTLTAKADRLDSALIGDVLVDYKTGLIPTGKDVAQGRAPQMGVEAWLLEQGAFGQGRTLAGLEFWKLPSSGDEGLSLSPALGQRKDSDEERAKLVADAQEGLMNLAQAFCEEGHPFEAIPGGASPLKAEGVCTYCDYAGICRFKDWLGGSA